MSFVSSTSADSSLCNNSAIRWQMQYITDYFDLFMRSEGYPGTELREDAFENFPFPHDRVPRGDPALRPQRRPRTRTRKA